MASFHSFCACYIILRVHCCSCITCICFSPVFRHPARRASKPSIITSRQHVTISYNDEYKVFETFHGTNEGPGILPTLGLAFIILIFVGTSFLPLLDAGGPSGNLSIADSVVTKQDNPDKFKNYENKFDRLSRATIQEKLNAVPVFYLVDNDDGTMKSDIFMSFEDATDAAKGGQGYNLGSSHVRLIIYALIFPSRNGSIS